MEKNEVKSILKDIFIDVLDLEVDKEHLSENHLIEEYGLNSVDALEILMHIEKKLDIEIDEEDLTADLVNSMDELSSYVLNKLENGKT
jgi:acyl carrier protein